MNKRQKKKQISLYREKKEKSFKRTPYPKYRKYARSLARFFTYVKYGVY